MIKRKRPRRLIVAIVIGGLVAAIGAVSPVSATASPADRKGTGATNPPLSASPHGQVPAGFSSWADVLRVQKKLNAAAQRIQSAPGAKDNLAGIVARPESRRLKVYWKGTPPTATRELIRALRAQVPIDVLPARFSSSELFAASKTVANRPGVASASGNVDGSGVTVKATLAAARSAALTTSVGAIPVTVVSGSQPVAAACTGRQDDCSPYWGGAAIPTNRCTLGFGILRDGTPEMVSAGHCANDGDIINDGGGENVGTVEWTQKGRDTLLIFHPNNLMTSASRVYIGAWNAGTGSSRAVVGASASFVGGVVCTSGSFTGEHCDIRIDAVNGVVNTNLGQFSPVVHAVQNSGFVAVGIGDSGGPVYFGNANGTVNAAGSISAMDTPIACPTGSPSPQCGTGVWYVDITLTLAFYGAEINTG